MIYGLLFGLSEILPKFGIHTLDPILTTTSQRQGSVAAAIQSWGTPVLVGLVIVTVLVVAWAFLSGRQREPVADAVVMPPPEGASQNDSPVARISVASPETLEAIKRAAQGN